MAEDDLDDEIDVAGEKAAEEARAAAAASAGKGKLMTLLFIAGALAVGLLGGGAGGYFIGSASATAPAHQEAAAGHGEEAKKDTPSIYINLPKVRTNIASARCRGLYIDLEVTAAVGSEEEAAVLRGAANQIKDGMTEYARSVTKEDLEGREGSERLRTNVEAVINNAIQPAKVREVLFKEFVLQ